MSQLTHSHLSHTHSMIFMEISCRSYPSIEYFLEYLPNKEEIWKIFEGEMFLRTQPINLHQICCETKLYFQVISNIIIDPDNTIGEILKHERVKSGAVAADDTFN